MARIGQDIDHAKELLLRSELVGIPTETVYGLGSNALDERALARIFVVKNRPKFDPLILHIPSFDKVKNIAKFFPDKAIALAKRFWPGALTLILPKKNHIPDLATSGLNSVAIRVPDHPLTLDLLNNLDFPLAAPSANPFGYISPTTAKHVNEQLGNKIPYILDGGRCGIGIESTIISFTDKVPTIMRLGGLSLEKIQSIIGNVRLQDDLSSQPQVPGIMKSHYAPSKILILGDIGDQLIKFAKGRVGILSFQKEFSQVPKNHQFVLSTKGDLEEAASKLFSALRSLDKLDVDFILAEKFPDHGIGRAINDRLKKASAKKQEK